jgi:hypothetical protein
MEWAAKPLDEALGKAPDDAAGGPTVERLERTRGRDVFSWFAPLTSQLLDFEPQESDRGRGHSPTSLARLHGLPQVRCRLRGRSDAGVDSKCHQSQILVPGELKSNHPPT